MSYFYTESPLFHSSQISHFISQGVLFVLLYFFNMEVSLKLQWVLDMLSRKGMELQVQ